MSLTFALASSLVLAASATAPRTSSRWMQQDEAARAAELEALRQGSLAERLLAISAAFVDTPYAESPLGEGTGKDPDPLLRYDAVDCQTFVETAMAMSVAPAADRLLVTLNDIRYRAEPSYEGRNHLMEAEWIPNNLRKGYLRDVTAELGGPHARVVAKALTEATWSSRTSRALELSKERQPLGSFKLSMVPLDRVLERARRAPEGTVMVVIRDDRPLLPTRVSHLGFLVHKKKRPYLRHASRSFRRVIDEDLESFVLRQSRYTKKTVVGAAFYEVRVPAAEAEAKATP